MAYAAVLALGVLVVFVVLLAFMRDTAHAPLRAVWRWLRCPQYERAVMVEFDERVQTGMAFRTVRNCPLRREGERCGEGCVWQPRLAP